MKKLTQVFLTLWELECWEVAIGQKVELLQLAMVRKETAVDFGVPERGMQSSLSKPGVHSVALSCLHVAIWRGPCLDVMVSSHENDLPQHAFEISVRDGQVQPWRFV